MATGPGLIIDIAEKRFDAAGPALFTDFHLDIVPGSTVAVVGPSGIGKSTLLRMLAGIDGHFTGSILVDVVPAQEAAPPGFVFQDPRLLPWLTAADNIRAANPQSSPAQAEAVLSQVGLDGVGSFYPRQLSGGMQRRVALARALAVNARLLLLDEPFVSLDRPLVEEMHQLLAEVISAAQPTLVFVSHLADDAARLADRVIMLKSRPARIEADISLSIPRAERTKAVLSAYTELLESKA